MSLNDELQRDPLAFAKKYCILAETQARVGAKDQKKISGHEFSKSTGLGKISWLNCQRVELAAEFAGHNSGGLVTANEGADTVLVTAGRIGVPTWFLPWDPRGGTVKLSIPSFAKFDLGFWNANKHYGGSQIGGGKIIEEYPRFFLTAAINGCSVFITGTQTDPTVYHSGKGAGVEGDAIEVWRDMMLEILDERIKSGKSTEQIQAEVNKSHYVKDGVSRDGHGYATTKQANTFEAALNRHYDRSPVQILEVRPWGAVFGVCDEFGHWEFYLQENATIRYDIVDKKLLGLKKKTRKFSVSRPMVVRKIFPGGGATVELRSTFQWMPL